MMRTVLIAAIVCGLATLRARAQEQTDPERRRPNLHRIPADSLHPVVPQRGSIPDSMRYTMPWVQPDEQGTAHMPYMVIPDSIKLHLRIKKYELQRVAPSDRQSDRYRRQQFTDR